MSLTQHRGNGMDVRAHLLVLNLGIGEEISEILSFCLQLLDPLSHGCETTSPSQIFPSSLPPCPQLETVGLRLVGPASLGFTPRADSGGEGENQRGREEEESENATIECCMPFHLRGRRLSRPGLAVALLFCEFAWRSEAFLLLPSALCPAPATSVGWGRGAHLSRIAGGKPLQTWIPTLLPCTRSRPSWLGADTVMLCQGEDPMGVEVAPQERKPRRRGRSKRANKKSKKRSPSVMDCKSSSSAIKMLSNSTKPLRLVDFNHALRVCARDRGNVDAAQRVFAIMDEANIAGDHFSYNTLLDCIAKSAQLRGEMAFKEGMSTIELMKKQGVEPDLYSFNALLNIAAKGASQRGDKEWVSRGLQVLQMMQSHGVMPDVVSYNVLIDACSRAAGVKGSRGRVEEGMNVLRQMTDAGIQPDIVSFNSLINVCAKAARVWGSVGVSQASRVLQMMEECNVEPDGTTFNCLLNAYAQAAGAGQVYSWDEMVGVLDLMKERGITPDVYTYNCVLNVCAKTSRVRRTATNAEWGWLKVS